MSFFEFRAGTLYAEGVAADAIAQQHGTPCYVYSRAALETALRAYQGALADWPHLICYAVKANSNLAVLDVLARLGVTSLAHVHGRNAVAYVHLRHGLVTSAKKKMKKQE